MAPGAKFSTQTSAFRNKSLTSASPRSDFRFAVTDFLLALNSRKYQESCPGAPRKDLRPGSPRFGFSTLTTSAPSQASASVQEGTGLELREVENQNPCEAVGRHAEI